MRSAVLTALAVACVLVPQASAKGPLALCGPAACATLGSETTISWSPADGSHVTAPAPAPFYKLRFADHQGDPLAYWVPSAGVLRAASQGDAAVWFRPSAEEAVALEQATAGLNPFAAPTRASVTVGLVPVPRGDWSYVRLFRIGTPAASASTHGWLSVDLWGPDTPWTQCMACISVSRTGAYLKRSGGDLLSIPPRIAYLVRHRLPLR